MTTEPPPLDVERILSTLTRRGVEFLLVGGVAAIAHGARRLTVDLDCLAQRTYANLDRLAAALRDLNARVRVEGLDDAEAALLPVRIDRESLGRMEISTWRTDAGDFDILADLPSSDGSRLRYDDLIGRANTQPLHGITVRVAALDDIIASKEWANRPKDHEALDELRRLASGGGETRDPT
ncbi:MAG: nucleotidyl transferase AbiEii/AbiGii toxin family protein [Acidimicrobiales bacterium]